MFIQKYTLLQKYFKISSMDLKEDPTMQQAASSFFKMPLSAMNKIKI